MHAFIALNCQFDLVTALLNKRYFVIALQIDLKKMPLGKLSRRQLMAAFSVLTEAQQLLNQDCKTNGPMILDCSNRFYTLIPHDFGINTIPLLDNLDLIKVRSDLCRLIGLVYLGCTNSCKSRRGPLC